LRKPLSRGPRLAHLWGEPDIAHSHAHSGKGARVDQSREPILNVPTAVVALLVLLSLVHAFREWVLSPADDRLLLLAFAFVPARYDATMLLGGVLPGGFGAQIWTFFTYALIHADLMHLGFNALWLLAFGSPVARRFGAARFVAFCLVTVAAGALAHLVTHPGERVIMVGASAAVSGMMGAATRFAFEPGGSLDFWRPRGVDPDRIPAASLSRALRNPRVLTFVAVWFAVNLLFGIGSLSVAGFGHNVAWEAHVGGFLAGLLLFSLFDPVAPQHDGGRYGEP
jgi:membrane associated rhomboid family serine protease